MELKINCVMCPDREYCEQTKSDAEYCENELKQYEKAVQ